MTLVKYNQPKQNRLSTNFSDMLDEFFNDAVSKNRDSFVPNIDVSESDDKFEISAELPGIKKEDINVSLDNRRLSITGERKFKKEEEGKKFHRVETSYGSFNRSLQLPDNIEEDSIKASYKHGLLNITINKAAGKVKKQIDIK